MVKLSTIAGAAARTLAVLITAWMINSARAVPKVECFLGGTGPYCYGGVKQSTRPDCERWNDGYDHCFLADHPGYPTPYDAYMTAHPEYH